MSNCRPSARSASARIRPISAAPTVYDATLGRADRGDGDRVPSGRQAVLQPLPAGDGRKRVVREAVRRGVGEPGERGLLGEELVDASDVAVGEDSDGRGLCGERERSEREGDGEPDGGGEGAVERRPGVGHEQKHTVSRTGRVDCEVH